MRINVDGVDLSGYVRNLVLPKDEMRESIEMPPNPLFPFEFTLEGEWSATMTPQQVMAISAPEWANVKEGDVVRLKYGDDTIEALVDEIAFDSEGDVFYSFSLLQSVI